MERRRPGALVERDYLILNASYAGELRSLLCCPAVGLRACHVIGSGIALWLRRFCEKTFLPMLNGAIVV